MTTTLDPRVPDPATAAEDCAALREQFNANMERWRRDGIVVGEADCRSEYTVHREPIAKPPCP